MKKRRYLALGVREALKQQGRSMAWLARELGMPSKTISDYLDNRSTAGHEAAEAISAKIGIDFNEAWLEDKPPVPLRILLEPEGKSIVDHIIQNIYVNYAPNEESLQTAIQRSISEIVEEEVLNELVRARIDRKAKHTRRLRDQARASILNVAPAYGGAQMEPGVSGRTEVLVGSK